MMPPAVACKALDFLIAHSGHRKHLEVDLFGGEPLMNMETVRAVVGYGRELEQRHGKQINFTITTNGPGADRQRSSISSTRRCTTSC